MKTLKLTEEEWEWLIKNFQEGARAYMTLDPMQWTEGQWDELMSYKAIVLSILSKLKKIK